jgi:hypothetical protein
MALNFQIKLEDQVSPSAQKAASSLHQLDAAIKNESASLRTLQAEMLGMKKAGHASSEAFKMLSGAIADQRMKVAALKDKMLDAGGLPQAGKAAGLLESIMGSLTSKLGGAGRALGALGPYGIAAAAVTRSLELLYGGQKAAEHTYKVLEAITGDIAISQGRVMELADTLIQAGQVNGDAMVKSIAAIGKAEAARKGAGAVLEGVITRATSARIFSISRAELMKVGISYKELSKEIAKGIGSTAQDAELRLRTGGVSVKAGLDALSKVVDTKMGDLAMKKFATVGAQTQRLRDLFGRLFEGVDSGPFGRVLMAIANTLEESSVTGSALRTVLKSAFDELSAAAERVAPYVQTFFEGAILLALRFYNALYPVRQAIAKLFGGADEGGLKKTEDTILNLANNVGAGFDLAAKAIAFMIENAGKLAKVIEVLVTLTPGIGAAFTAAKAAILAITSDMTAKQDRSQKSGQAVAEGVAAGIQQKTPAVEAAMAAMGEKGMKAFDAKMQIHSPSKAMQLRGRYLNEGLARGVNDNADAPAKAMAQSGAGAGAAATAGAKAAGGQSGGGPVINVHFASGAIQGMGGAAELQDSLTHTLGDVFYRFAVMQGTG